MAGLKVNLWWLPSLLTALAGLFLILAGIVIGKPDLIGGLIMGGVALAAAGIMHSQAKARQQTVSKN